MSRVVHLLSLFAIAALLIGNLITPLPAQAAPALQFPWPPPPRPDLVPGGSYVTPLSNLRYLHVRIWNVGPAPAIPSTAKITFSHPGMVPFTRVRSVGPLNPGMVVEVSALIPAGFAGSGCTYVITVDSTNAVNEGSGEGNNVGRGSCK